MKSTAVLEPIHFCGKIMVLVCKIFLFLIWCCESPYGFVIVFGNELHYQYLSHPSTQSGPHLALIVSVNTRKNFRGGTLRHPFVACKPTSIPIPQHFKWIQPCCCHFSVCHIIFVFPYLKKNAIRPFTHFTNHCVECS